MSTLTFWVSAFIPNSVAGYTIALKSGPHAGKTAIPLPSAARLWVGNTFKAWNAGYLTDQRSFMPSPTASTRMRSLIEIDIPSCKEIKQEHKSSGTTEVDLASGVQKGFAFANMSRCSFKANANMTSYDFYRYLEAAAGDPLVGMAADIDYKGELVVTVHKVGAKVTSVVVDFNGKIDSFPAFECYASLNGVVKTLFTKAPPAGNTVTDLLGGPTTPVSGRVTF